MVAEMLAGEVNSDAVFVFVRGCLIDSDSLQYGVYLYLYTSWRGKAAGTVRYLQGELAGRTALRRVLQVAYPD